MHRSEQLVNTGTERETVNCSWVSEEAGEQHPHQQGVNNGPQITCAVPW